MTRIFIINVDPTLNQFGHNLIPAGDIGCLLVLACFRTANRVGITGTLSPIEHSHLHREDAIEMGMVLKKRIHVVGLQYLQKTSKD